MVVVVVAVAVAVDVPYETHRQTVSEIVALLVDVVVWMFTAGAKFCRARFTEHHTSRSHQLHSELPAGLYAAVFFSTNRIPTCHKKS